MATTTDTLIFEFKVKDDASKVFDAWERKLNSLENDVKSTFKDIEKAMTVKPPPLPFGSMQGAFNREIAEIERTMSKLPGRAKRSFDGMATSALGAFGIIASGAAKAFGVVWDGLEKISDVAWDFATDSVDAFQTFEEGLAEVSQTTGFTGEQLQDLGKYARELARPIGDLTSTDLLTVMEQAGSLGVIAGQSFEEARETLGEFSVQVGKASIVMKSFGNDTGKIAKAVATVQNVFDMTADTSGNLLSMWTKLRQETGATEKDVASFMTQMSRGQATLKLTAPEAGALAGVFRNAGLESANAAKLLTSASLNISKGGKFVGNAVDLIRNQLDGGAQSIVQLEQITGRTAESFGSAAEMLQRAFGMDALATMQLLSQAFVETTAQTKDYDAATRASQFAVEAFGKRPLAVIKALGAATLKTADDTKSWAYILSQVEPAFASAEEHLTAYERAIQKSGQASKQFGSSMTFLKETVGGPLAQAFATLLNDHLTPLINQFGSWLDSSNLMGEMLPRMLARVNEAFGVALQSATEFVQGLDWNQFFERVEVGFNSLMVAIESIDWAGVFSTIKTEVSELWAILQEADWKAFFSALGTVAKEALKFMVDTLPKIVSLTADVVDVFGKMEGVIKVVAGVEFLTMWGHLPKDSITFEKHSQTTALSQPRKPPPKKCMETPSFLIRLNGVRKQA